MKASRFFCFTIRTSILDFSFSTHPPLPQMGKVLWRHTKLILSFLWDLRWKRDAKQSPALSFKERALKYPILHFLLTVYYPVDFCVSQFRQHNGLTVKRRLLVITYEWIYLGNMHTPNNSNKICGTWEGKNYGRSFLYGKESVHTQK